MIMEAAREGDVIAIEAFRTTGKWIGAGVASLSAILDPETVVIGGGVIDAGELLLEPIREAAKRHMPFSEILPMPEIVGATLGNQAALPIVLPLLKRNYCAPNLFTNSAFWDYWRSKTIEVFKFVEFIQICGRCRFIE
jgi:predicted NBD/HSP70 family sugar kinase